MRGLQELHLLQIKHHRLSELFIRARLDKFPGRWVGCRRCNSMSSAKSRYYCLWHLFVGWQSRSVPIKNTNISWTETTYSKYLCPCSSWFLKEKRSALSRLQKCPKCWGLRWNLTLNDIAWAINSTDIIYYCTDYYV